MTLDPGLWSYLALGVTVGMTHALEADHLAAVASLAVRSRSVRDTMRVGMAWGAGHALVLAVVAGALVALGMAMPGGVASLLELAVGVMLVLLGADVIRRLLVERVHVHQHRHGDVVHLHAHSHASDDRARGAARHAHAHRRDVPLRALLVGMTHGMAGSAALVVLAAGSAPSPLRGIAYVALFGAGSIVGMAALSAAIAVPLTRCERLMTLARTLVHGAVGATTIAVGASIVAQSALALR